MNPTKTFFKNVRRIAKKRKMSLRQIAISSGMTHHYFTDVKRRTRNNSEGINISLNSACKIADTLGVYVSALIEEGDYTTDDLE